jgi:hypothetical protein
VPSTPPSWLAVDCRQRPADATTFDVLRDLLPTLEPPDETFGLRMKILGDQALRDRHRARLTRVERLLAASIAKDLGAAAAGRTSRSSARWSATSIRLAFPLALVKAWRGAGGEGEERW